MFLLRDLDLFKANPETRFKGQRGGHSFLFGRTLTICIISMSIGLLVYFSLNMLTKRNPQIETFNAISTGNLILNNDTFPFAFAMRDINNKFYVDENIYTVGAYFASSLKNITLTLCKPTAFPGVYDPATQIAIYCFSDKQEFVDEIGINGAGGLVINFYKCDNNTNPNCRNESEIDEIVYRSRLRILYHDVSISPDDYESPMSEIITAWDPSVARTVVKENAMFLSQNYFISDSGWLFSNPKNTSKITFDERLQYFEDNEIMGNVFNVIYVRTYGQIRYTKRIYDSLQTILPRWNAMFTLLMVFGKIISDAYNRFKSQETLIQDIFFLKEKKFRREKTRSPSKSPSVSVSQSYCEGPKDNQSPPMSPPQSHRQFFPTRSIETSPVRKMRRALTTYHYRPKEEEPKTGDENQPLTDRKHENDEGQKQPDDALTLWELLKQTDYEKKPSIIINNELQASQSKLNLLNKLSTINNELQASQSNLNVWDIELNASGKQDLKSENQVKGPDLEDGNPPLPLRRERTKRDLFKDGSDVNFCTWVASRIKKSEHFKLHLKRESIIQEEFDFENYAKRFIGIDVLKYLLLSKDQLMVFDNCVKAYVNLKLDTLTRGSATDDAIFDELRTMFNTKGFPAEAEDAALLRLKEMPYPDEATKKALYLLEVLYERET